MPLHLPQQIRSAAFTKDMKCLECFNRTAPSHFSHAKACKHAALTQHRALHMLAHAGGLRSHALGGVSPGRCAAHGRTCQRATLTCWAWGSPGCRASAGRAAACTGALCAPQTSWRSRACVRRSSPPSLTPAPAPARPSAARPEGPSQ